MFSKFTTITPCFNAEKYIAETISSVLNQKAVISKKVKLEYIICDGGSTDKTIDIIQNLFANVREKNVSVKLISEKDSGMYDALAKGIKIGSGDIFSYLNADDFYSPTAFDVVDEILNSNKVSWLTGFIATYNKDSQLFSIRFPFKYRNKFIQCGLYDEIQLPFIQQESTFWKAELNNLIDYEKLKQFKLAGDYYIWKCFSAKADLYIVYSWLGGFRLHKGQMSENTINYLKEKDSFILPPKPYDYLIAYLDKMVWKCPIRIKKMFNPRSIFTYDIEKQKFVLEKSFVNNLFLNI